PARCCTTTSSRGLSNWADRGLAEWGSHSADLWRMVAPAARPSRKGRLALFRWTPAKQVWRAHIDRFPFGQPVTCPVGASGHQNSVGASAGVDGEWRLVVLPDGTAVAALVDSVAASPSVAERRPD